MTNSDRIAVAEADREMERVGGELDRLSPSMLALEFARQFERKATLDAGKEDMINEILAARHRKALS